MSDARLTLLVDAGFDGALPSMPAGKCGEPVRLIEDGSEFVEAVARSALREHCRGLPDPVWLELYAYEILERMRERLTCREAGEAEARPSRTETWVVPLWPACLFAAAETAVHAGREIARLFPAFDAVAVRERDHRAVEAAEQRVLGRVACAPTAYRRELLSTATHGGWLIIPDDDQGAAPGSEV